MCKCALTESRISGKALNGINREALKDIGIESVGTQLELMELIKDMKGYMI